MSDPDSDELDVRDDRHIQPESVDPSEVEGAVLPQTSGETDAGSRPFESPDGGGGPNGQDATTGVDANVTVEPAVAGTQPGASSTVGAPLRVDTADAPMGISRLPQEITRLVREQGGEVRIELSPEGLGEISIRISLGADGEVSIEIEADNDRTATVLGRLHESLEASLRGEGIELDSFDVHQQEDAESGDDAAHGDVDGASEETDERFDFLSEIEEIDLTDEQRSNDDVATNSRGDQMIDERPHDLRI